MSTDTYHKNLPRRGTCIERRYKRISGKMRAFGFDEDVLRPLLIDVQDLVFASNISTLLDHSPLRI